MARITIPEFKSGELVDPETFNQMNEQFRSLEIDDENLAIEGIHQRSIRDNTVFDDIVVSDLKASPLIKTKWDSDDLPDEFPVYATDIDTSRVGDKISFPSVLSTEKVIVRASCRVTMDDFGARHYAVGIPPWVALMIRITEGGSSSWTDLPETLQHFAVAFSGRADLAGTLEKGYEFSIHDGGITGEEALYRGLFTFPYNKAFNYDFSYTSAYLYAPSTDQTNVSFQVWGFQQYYHHNTDSSLIDPSPVPERFRPKQVGFNVQDYTITAHKIKR